MIEWLVPALLLCVLLVLLWVLWLHLRPADTSAQQAFSLSLRADGERLERELRQEVQESARGTRQELSGSLSLFQQAVLTQSGDIARTQNDQIDSFRTQLGAMQAHVSTALQGASQALAAQTTAAREAQDQALQRHAESTRAALQGLGESLAEQLRGLTQANDRRLTAMSEAVETRLTALQEGNEKKLEQMRATVDEKLHATLEQRLGESFKQVAERLEQVHQGLGDMRNLARDVGSLNRVLTNVKTRGVYGEMQLAGLLEQVFTPAQYSANVETVPGSGHRVEFAIHLPGRELGGKGLWLPIDAKFPREDYERLLIAQEQADAPAAEAAARALEVRLRLEAKTIRDKYLAAPHTTDFGILFVPTESLYAEALRRPGLVEDMQREYRIMLAGPTTLLATLSSLQMGFRTLALEQRSAEVWEVLGAVKTEFSKFGSVLEKTRKKLDEAASQIALAERRTRVMTRELRSVEAMPETRVDALLPGLNEGDEVEEG
jgi:DNA recombination protein RmuC